MPQLILHPWFLVFSLMWLSLIIFSPKKILSHVSLKTFIMDLHTHQASSWMWPWQ